MSRPIWSDHFEHWLTLDHAGACRGKPEYSEGLDQGAFCAGGCIVFNDGDFHLPVGKLAEFVTAMHEAAGLPAPVILERPEVTFKDGVNRAGRIEVGRLGDRVTVGLYGIQPEELEPDVARRLAALIAVRAGEAQDGEPDPAEVEELATILHDAREVGVKGRHGEWDTSAARAALRWMRDKQQRGESRDG